MTAREPADAYVWRSTNADLLNAWAVLTGEHLDAAKALREYAREVDPDRERDPIERGLGRITLEGFSHRSDWPVPDGWRVVNGGLLHIVPRMSTRAGKEARRRLDALRPGDPREVLRAFGVPSPFIGGTGAGGMRLYQPSAQVLGGVFYVKWNRAPEQQHDPAIWTPVPLSAYYAAVEAHRALHPEEEEEG